MIWVSFYLNREKVHFSTRIEIRGEAWSKKIQKVNGKDKEAADKNLILENVRARINNVIVKYRLKDKKINRETFMRAYRRPNDFETFFDFARHYQEIIKGKSKESTVSIENTVLKKLEEKFPELGTDELDVEKLDEFFGYLLKEKENNMNTAYKNMTVLKKFIRAGMKMGYIEENPFEQWKIKKTTSSVEYLNEEELKECLKKYEEGELKEIQHKTLEIFLFLCFSSLHIGDAKELKLEQINEKSFTYYRKKLEMRNPKPILVPVSEPLKRIIRNMVGTRKKGKVITEAPAEQVMNRELKEIMKEIGIEKKISLKVGRHTFATIYLRKTKDLAGLKEIMGHSEFRETMVYAHVIEEQKIEGVEKAFKDF